ncbi:MAG: hypothetical protein MH204_00845 [Fimbriimonadaceae bacterium]|nr:hypothetical protein [Fimbriimonadaceae bacterium]
MARFRNFSLWRGRLPHWRADGEVYYVTFRHRRALEPAEKQCLYDRILRMQQRRLDFLFLSVRGELTEMLFRVQANPEGQEPEFSDFLEKAKRKAGQAIIKRSGERFPPFFQESYDRIMRDAAELEEHASRLIEATDEAEDCLFAIDPAEMDA